MMTSSYWGKEKEGKEDWWGEISHGEMGTVTVGWWGWWWWVMLSDLKQIKLVVEDDDEFYSLFVFW